MYGPRFDLNVILSVNFSKTQICLLLYISLKPERNTIICNCLVVASVLVTRLFVKYSSLTENRKLLPNDTGPCVGKLYPKYAPRA